MQLNECIHTRTRTHTSLSITHIYTPTGGTQHNTHNTHNTTAQSLCVQVKCYDNERRVLCVFQAHSKTPAKAHYDTMALAADTVWLARQEVQGVLAPPDVQ